MTTEAQQEEEKPEDSRSTISAAYEAYEIANEDADEPGAFGAVADPVESTETAPDDAATDADKNAGTLSLPGKSPHVKDAPDEAAVPTEEKQKEFKPPQSWTPAAREEWSKVPDALKAQISKREGEMHAVFEERKELRHVNDNVGKLFAPFASMFQAQGTDPWQGTHNVLNLAAQLQGGSPTQKAQVTLQLIKDFGVDIALLDDLMVGKQSTTPQADELAVMRTQLAQTQQWQQQQQRQQQQQYQQQQQVTDTEVSAFVESHEFAPDLRLQMADFMDMAEKGAEGKISMDVAYERALASRPDLQSLITNRQTSEDNTDALAKAKAASVSVPQTSKTGGDKIAPTDRREALLDAWDNG